MHFADQLITAIIKKQSPICLGLDPHFDMIPEELKKNSTPEKIIEKFLITILDSCHDLVSCCKPNYAFFEEFGWQGIRALETVSEHAKKLGLTVIVDGKRNDIGSTAAASARGFLDRDIYDALTVNPYLGEDGIRPFADLSRENGKGIFVLVKTSNPSGGQFQDLPCEDGFIFDEVARAVNDMGLEDIGDNNFSSVGAVVGATYPEDLRMLRSEMPAQIFLIPGYGAQGGSAKDVMPAFYDTGMGAIVNSSRGILFASKDKDYAEAARLAAEKAKEEFSNVFRS